MKKRPGENSRVLVAIRLKRHPLSVTDEMSSDRVLRSNGRYEGVN